MRRIVYVLLSILIILVLLYTSWQYSKSRISQLFGNIINKVDTDQNLVALTFDDGPTKNTDQVLEILDELDIKATFFVTGKELEASMAEAKKIVSHGHQLANHSYSHSQMVLKSYGFIKNEIESTDQLIREAGYKGEIYFRPPYCKKLVMLPYYLSRQNKTSITWNIEPESYSGVGASSKNIVKHVNDNITSGSIILLHVMYDSREQSLKAINGIVKSLREKDYEFKTISELINYQS
jgi:chitin deacetylase